MSFFFLLPIGIPTGVVPASPTALTGGWGAGGLVGYHKKGERPSDTHVRLLSELDPVVVQEIGDVETNDQTDNVSEEIKAPIEPLLTHTDAAARMRSRLEEQKRVAAEIKARQLEDDDETFFMLN